MKTALAYTLKRLETDYVDIYRPARLDPNTPIEDTIGAIAHMVKLGYVRHIGLSEVGAATIRRAAAVHPIADVQIEYSLISRGVEDSILPTCRALGIGVTAYGVLSWGLISGHWSKEKTFYPRDFRAHIPRFNAENIDQNLALVEAIKSIADAKNATVAQIAIACVLSRGYDVAPLIGARRRDQLAESLGALALTLSRDDLAALERALPKERRPAPVTPKRRWRIWIAKKTNPTRNPRNTPALAFYPECGCALAKRQPNSRRARSIASASMASANSAPP